MKIISAAKVHFDATNHSKITDFVLLQYAQ